MRATAPAAAWRSGCARRWRTSPATPTPSTNINTRISVANLSLQRLNAIGSEVKGAAVSAGSTLDNTGQTPGQKTAILDFFDSVDMLNAQSGDRYLFSGRATDTAPVTAADQIMNGNGAAIAGLKQVISERHDADVGTNGMGRTIVVDRRDGDLGADRRGLRRQSLCDCRRAIGASPFGLKLTSIATTIAGATVTQPTETPPTTRAGGAAIRWRWGSISTATFRRRATPCRSPSTCRTAPRKPSS